MNDAALVNDLTEILSQALNQEQLDAFGRLLCKGFDAHSALKLDRHVTVPKRRAAAALIEICKVESQDRRASAVGFRDRWASAWKEKQSHFLISTSSSTGLPARESYMTICGERSSASTRICRKCATGERFATAASTRLPSRASTSSTARSWLGNLECVRSKRFTNGCGTCCGSSSRDTMEEFGAGRAMGESSRSR